MLILWEALSCYRKQNKERTSTFWLFENFHENMVLGGSIIQYLFSADRLTPTVSILQ